MRAKKTVTKEIIAKKTAFALFLALYILLTLNIAFSQENSTNTSDNSTNISLNITLNETINATGNSSNISIDNDIDGYNSTVDCNDNNSSINPGAPEILYDGIDQDCNGLDAVDADNDSFNYTIDCNDTQSSINPAAQEILYNLLDDDCNPFTSDTILFNITTSKEEYNIGENASFTVIAQNNSNVNISFKVPSNYYAYQAQYINQTYPITDAVSSTRKNGIYTILGSISYKGFVLYLNKTFSVKNSISISVTGETSIDENQTLSLSADASGGYGSTYTYIWQFGDGTNATTKNVTHKYASPGEYTITVSAKDSEGNENNKQFTVTVYRLYSIKIIATDKTTGISLADATIDIDGKSKTSGTDGSALFSLRRGKYDVIAFKSGYALYNSEYDLTQNSTLVLQLAALDSSAPVITLKNSQAQAADGKASLNFMVSDASRADCSVYTSSDGNWWSLAGKITGITDALEKSLSINVTGSDALRYKIECIDSESNTALSEEGTIMAGQELSAAQSTAYDALKQSFENAKAGMLGVNSKENDIYTLLSLDVKQKDAERLLSSYNRDVESILTARCPGTYCGLTDPQKQEKIDEITTKLQQAVNSTASRVTVTNFEEFVKYPNKTDVESAVKRYFESKNKVLTKSQLKSLVEKNFRLQTQLTSRTKIYHSEIEYASGKKETITLVKKELELYNSTITQNSKNTVLIEDLQMVDDAKIVFLTSSSDLGHGLYDVSQSQNYLAYYGDGDMKRDLKNSNTLMISTSVEKQGITGFAFFSGLGGLKDINYFWLVIIILALIILIRIAMMFGLFAKISAKVSRRIGEKDYHAMMMLVNDARDYMEGGDINKAGLIYKEIKLKYESLPKETRARIYDNIFSLSQALDEGYIRHLIKEAKDGLKDQKTESARHIYEILEKAYKNIPDSSKKSFEQEIIEIHSKISLAIK